MKLVQSANCANDRESGLHQARLLKLCSVDHDGSRDLASSGPASRLSPRIGTADNSWRPAPPGATCGSSRLDEKPPLLLADRHRELFHHLEHVFPDPALLAQSLVAQQVRGMIGRHERRAAVRTPLAAQL